SITTTTEATEAPEGSSADTTSATTKATTTTTKVTTTTTTKAPSSTTAVSEDPKGLGIKLDIEEYEIASADEAGSADDPLELNINIENAINSYGGKFAVSIPEVTAKLIYLWQDDSGSYDNSAYSNSLYITHTNFNEVSKTSAYRLLTSFSAPNVNGVISPITAEDGSYLTYLFYVDYDEAASLAVEYGLTAQTNEKGTYYDFPIEWAEFGVDTLKTWDNINNVYVEELSNRFEMLDDSGIAGTLIDWQENVVTWGGAIRIYTDAVADTTTTTEEEQMPINMVLDTVYMYPAGSVDTNGEEVAAFGEQAQEYNAYVTADDGVDASSWGLSCAFVLPEVTAKLVSITGIDAGKGIYLSFGESGLVNSSEMQAYYAGDSSASPYAKMAAINQVQATNPVDTGLFQVLFEIPDEETVEAIAKEYGLEKQYADGVWYYEFPVTWAEQAMDGGWTVEDDVATWVESPRFQYMDSTSTTGV
ncbi:MAG: hypothetical protein LUC50_09310, partial [Ruminococcus sp.]|nr:hypothetical protein [Ruminococcus sp.]